MRTLSEPTKTEDTSRPRIKNSFAARMSFSVIALTAVLFIGTSVTVSIYSHNLIHQEAIKDATSLLKSTNLEIENVLLGVSVAIDNLADEVEMAIQQGDREHLFELTRKVVSQNKHIIGSDIGLEPYYYKDSKYFSPYSFQQGDSIVTTQVGNDNYVYHYMEWYQIPKLLGHSYWTDPFYDVGAGNIIMCTYTRPLYDKDNQFIGVLTADLPIDWLTDMVNAIQPYENSYNLMIGKGAAYIVHPDVHRILYETIFTKAMGWKDTTLLHLGHEMVSRNSGMVTLEDEGDLSFVFYAPVPSSGWSLAMVCPHEDVFADVYRMSTFMIIVAVFGLGFLFFFTKMIIGKLSKPLAEFSNSARSIAKGDFNAPLPEIRTEDEMHELRNSFQYMQHSLTSYIAELQSTTAVKERIESELSIARNIQMGMIPKIFPPFPERKDLDIYAILRPAKEVGGDLYDFFINRQKLYFTVGDVSGKGVPASLFMAVTRSLFRSVAINLNLEDPGRIVESMNKSMSDSNESNMFVTMFVGILDLETGKLVFCNAGHNPPCLLFTDGRVNFMEVHPNLPLGLFSNFRYESQSITLAPGTTMFLYTDGLTEAENVKSELYGESRLLQSLTGGCHTDAQSLISKILASVEAHVNHAVQSDDLTMLAIKCIGNG